jgi:phage terminase large subunit
MPTIQLPNGWKPRDYQRPLWSYLERGGKRAIEIAHRRWGKDDVGLHWAAVDAMQNVGGIWHMLPEAAQARKAIWDAVNPHTGKRRIEEAFPAEIIQTKRDQDMFIRFVNGSTWQVVGSDNYNSLVGSPPRGIVFSEYALAKPAAWSYMRPILKENDGWALFITTPRGNNHAKTLLEAAQQTPGWFAEVSSIRDTKALSEEALEAELQEYIKENGYEVGRALFRQEYEASFDAAVIGSYYVGDIDRAIAERRIGQVPHDPALPVRTYWDLGLDDATAVWFVQEVGKEVRLIEYAEWTQQPLTAIAGEIMTRPYTYADHILPHDVRVREMTTGRSREEVLRNLLGRLSIAPQLGVEDGINALRILFPRLWIDEKNCAKGLEALRNYRKRWDEKRKTFEPRPHHDWASHGADAARMLAVTYRERLQSQERHDPYRAKGRRASAWAR